MKKKIIYLSLALIWFCLAISVTYAQKTPDGAPPPDKTINLDDDPSTQFLIENLVDEEDSEEFDLDTQFEYLEYFVTNPLDINHAKATALEALGLLSAIQIQALLNYRKRFGQIYSLFELQGVPVFDMNTIRKIAPYISLSASKEKDKLNLNKMFRYAKNQFYTRYQQVLEKQRGYIDTTGTYFLGSPDKWYFRYNMSYKNRMSLGVTLEKDAGEQWLNPLSEQKKGRFIDYFSAHFFLSDLSKNVKAVALGDYRVYFGQGLTAWDGFRVRKGVDVLNIKRISLPLKPYTSVNESLFLRGAAVCFAFGTNQNIESTVFASHRFQNGNRSTIVNMDSDSTNGRLETTVISALYDDGNNRTAGELSDKNSTEMVSAGANIKYRSRNWHLALNTTYVWLNPPIDFASALYRSLLPGGQHFVNISLDYSYLYRNLQFFGETAVSQAGGLATVNGFLSDLDSRISVAILHRYYSRRYLTLLGNSFGEGSSSNNESGLYFAVQSSFGKGVKWSSYFDVYRFRWLRFLTDAPSLGYEYLFKLDYAPNYRISMYTQLRFEEKELNLSGNLGKFDELIPHRRQSWRLHLRYRLNKNLELRNRIELSWFKDDVKSRGFMAYQDFVFTPPKLPFKAQLRFAVFDTDSYDTRIYAYENDVLYAFSVPPYYGRGLRYYLNLNYQPSRMLSFWLRFAQTHFADRDVISSGTGEIQGSNRSEVKAQMRIKF